MPESVKNIVFASKVCIKNIYQNEYLYAANDYFSYDNDRGRVFTWIPKDEKNDKFRWEIELDGDDYSIMNVKFNEYLYGAVDHFNYDNERRKVFTWIPKNSKSDQFKWDIEDCGYAVKRRDIS